MNSVLCLTGNDSAMDYIGDLTAPLIEAYAARHGFDFRREREYSTETHPAWQKLEKVVKAFRDGYQQVRWFDADVAITNPARCDRHEFVGFHVSRDWGEDAAWSDFNTGVFIANNDPSTYLMFKYATELRKYEWADYYDQGALRQYFAMGFGPLISIAMRRRFNSVHSSVVGVVEPWEPGDFVCHLTGLDKEQRVKIFHEVTGT